MEKRRLFHRGKFTIQQTLGHAELVSAPHKTNSLLGVDLLSVDLPGEHIASGVLK